MKEAESRGGGEDSPVRRTLCCSVREAGWTVASLNMISAELLLLWIAYYCIDEGQIFPAVLIPGLVAVVVTFVVSILLICGIAYRHPPWLIPSMLWQIICLGALIGLAALYVYSMVETGTLLDYTEFLLIFIFVSLALGVVLQVLFLYVVVLCYFDLRQPHNLPYKRHIDAYNDHF